MHPPCSVRPVRALPMTPGPIRAAGPNRKHLKSVEKTNRLLVVDEDVPGGASSYILQHIIEEQKVYTKRQKFKLINTRARFQTLL